MSNNPQSPVSDPRSSQMPKHLGVILDGNRRWARAQGLPTLEGHRKGAEVFKEIALAAFDRGVQHISAYIFSTENWSRSEEEVGYLMNLVIKVTESQLDAFHKAGIRIVILGQRQGLSKKVLAAIERTEEKTKDNSRGTLALCFNYGGQQEIADAVRMIVERGTAPDEITPEIIEAALYHPEIPPVDLLIRTSGEQRLSGFMLYRAAYAELYFTDKHWPAFTIDDLDAALADYAGRDRRFGGN